MTNPPLPTPEPRCPHNWITPPECPQCCADERDRLLERVKELESPWLPIGTDQPPLSDLGRTKNYILAVDSKGRMSVAYAYRHSAGMIQWVMAKPIGEVTHWMPLPVPPITAQFTRA